MLREMATLWVRANVPYADIQAIFVEHLENAIRRQVTCSFTIGHKLTKSNRPFLVYGFRGELFVFELSSEQQPDSELKTSESAVLTAFARLRGIRRSNRWFGWTT